MNISAITDHKLRTAGIVGVLLFIISFIVFFATTDQEALRTEVEDFLSMARGSPWAFPLTLAFYIIGGAVMFPITVSNVAVAMVFGLWGILYGLVGSMASAVLFFGVGRWIGRHDISKKLMQYPRVQKIDHALADSGLIGITLLRYVPIAPYTVFNVAAGISSVSFLNYTLATLFSLVPGAVARGILGDSLTQLFLDPTMESWLYVGFGITLWAGLLWGVHVMLKKYEKKHNKKIA